MEMARGSLLKVLGGSILTGCFFCELRSSACLFGGFQYFLYFSNEKKTFIFEIFGVFVSMVARVIGDDLLPSRLDLRAKVQK